MTFSNWFLSFSKSHNSSNGCLDQTWRVYKSKALFCLSIILNTFSINLLQSFMSQPTLLRASEARFACASSKGNRSWRIFQIRELYLRLRKVLASLTFVPKDNILRLGLCEIMYLNLLFLFYFWGRQNRGSSSYGPSIEEEIRTT